MTAPESANSRERRERELFEELQERSRIPVLRPASKWFKVQKWSRRALVLNIPRK